MIAVYLILNPDLRRSTLPRLIEHGGPELVLTADR